MSTMTVEAPAPVVPRWWPVLRWATLGVYLTLMAGVLLTGARERDFSDLRQGLTDGSVTQVQIADALDGPNGLDPTTTGSATARLQWRDGWHDSFAEVEQVTPDQRDHSADGRPVIVGPVADELRRIAPDVHLTWADPPHRSGVLSAGTATVFGWESAGWLVWVVLTLMVLQIVTITFGPEPRWATKWAWFWLLTSTAGFITTPVYLLLAVAGPPRLPTGRRLTGGWAFLISRIPLALL